MVFDTVIGAGAPFMTIEQAVHRLTGELADWCQLDAGHLRIGDRAVFLGGRPTELLGKQRTGSFLRAKTISAPAPTPAAV